MKSIFTDPKYLLEEDCEYEPRCPFPPSKFCSSADKFSCKKYRELEERQMKLDDDL